LHSAAIAEVAFKHSANPKADEALVFDLLFFPIESCSLATSFQQFQNLTCQKYAVKLEQHPQLGLQPQIIPRADYD
jgi:hypothetical protein